MANKDTNNAYNSAPDAGQKKSKKVNEKKLVFQQERNKEQALRKKVAVNNTKRYYRAMALGSNGGLNRPDFREHEDVKQRKGKDYFFVMRKFVCFLMFLFLLISVALYVIGFVGLVPEYTSFMTKPDYTAVVEEGGEESENEENLTTLADTTEGEEEEDEEGEGNIIEPDADKSVYYTMMDPIFGFISKHLNIELGDSPLYNAMYANVEVGYANAIAGYIVQFFPIAMVLYIIVALVCMIKAFLAMFGKRVYKRFGLGAIIMLICAGVTLLGGVFSNMAVSAEGLDFSGIMPFIMSGISAPTDIATAPVFVAGFGLLGMIAVPVIVLLLSMLAKKKVPFSVFD